MKKLLSLILALAMLLPAVFMTGCEFNFGADAPGGDIGPIPGGNGTDIPGGDGTETPGGGGESEQLSLIVGGVASFAAVYDHTLDTSVMTALNMYLTKLKNQGIDVKLNAGYNVNKIQDCEILVGTTFTGRDGYTVDVHDYGLGGYVIKVIDQKIIIAGGTPASTITAVEHFFENYIGLTDNGPQVGDVKIAKNLLVEKRPEYDIKTVSVLGTALDNSYYIRADKGNEENAAAQLLQSALYTEAGLWLDISCPAADPGKKIVVDLVGDAGEDGFRVFVDKDGNLTVQCAYKNAFTSAMNGFISRVIRSASGTLGFSADYSYTENVSVVKYSNFGADTTGKRDSFDAIISAHEYANEGGQRVEADEGATYYIGHHLKEAIVKTDTDWKNAKFIIDDTEVPTNQRNYWIFKIVNDTPAYYLELDDGTGSSGDTQLLNANKTTLDLSKFKKGSTNIGLSFSTPSMLHIVNNDKLVYIRAGANSGQDKQQEIVVVDENGNLDEDTPLIWDYDNISSIRVIPISDKAITVQGGEFTTYVNLETCGSFYYARGICLQRSNATVYNVKHYLAGEPETVDGSCPYYGFFYADGAAYATFEKCVMTGHRTYKTFRSEKDKVQQGNYDTQAVRCFEITWKDCTQSNDYNASKDSQGYTLWGVMASNFCKNLVFDGCYLSRFDAHRGVHNVTIKNSEVGEVINLVGSGTATFQNAKLSRGQNNYFIRIREDYGATWEGDIVIENCTLVSSSSSKAYVIRADWINWDFGYTCYAPNVYINGLTVVTKSGATVSPSNVYIFKNFRTYYDSNYSNKTGHTYYSNSQGSIIAKNSLNINPLVVPSRIETKNFAFNTYIEGTDTYNIFATTTKVRE